jgi:tetratricopeptide (TPR) repeat protein
VFDQALRINPFDSTLHGLRGWGLQSAGRLDEALSAMARSRAIDEDNPIGYYSAGLLYLDALGDPVEAETWSQRAAEVDPKDPELVAILAHIYLTLDDLPRAERMAQRALEMNSQNAFILSTRAQVHLRQGDEQAALALARRGLGPDIAQRFAGQLVSLRILRTNWLRQGRIAEAVRAYEATYPTVAKAADLLSAPIHMPQLETGELVRAAVDLAHLRMASGDESGAQALIRIVRAALDREPRMQHLRFYGPGTALAEIAILEGRNEEALVTLEQVVDTGWNVNWRWEIESNLIFDAVREEPAYRRIIDKLEANTRRQRERWMNKESGT